MSTKLFCDSITATRKALGNAVTVMAHHYQSDDVIRHADRSGDSLELARQVPGVDSEYIVLCGVYFMAESAALLAKPEQTVLSPEPGADCSLAMMAQAPAVEKVLAELTRKGRKVIPLTYVNSSLAVKAVVGKYKGSVCTSANARRMLDWALNEGDAVLFLPDMNLGANTANQLGLPELDRLFLTIDAAGNGLDSAAAEKARLLLWPGFCSIHTHFTVGMIEGMRTAHPGVKVVVHPESSPQVVAAADASGSTSFIIKYADDMPDGGTLVIGTEINLVQRLAEKHKGRIAILPLDHSPCSYMAEISEERLATVLETLATKGDLSRFRVQAAEALQAPAKETLERMLAVCR